MQIIPVVDLKDGIAVHAIGGTRHAYKPLQSMLHEASDLEGIATAFRKKLGLTSLYLADLDAIGGQTPSVELYARLSAMGMKLIVDPGIRNESSLEKLVDTNVEKWVIGLETIQGPGALALIVRRLGAERVMFSLDMRGLQPLGDTSTWNTNDPARIAAKAIAVGIKRLLLLDLSRVGMNGGIVTENLAKRILARHENIHLFIGGGIRGVKDLNDAAALGASGVLVATAIHNGTLGLNEIAAVGRNGEPGPNDKCRHVL